METILYSSGDLSIWLNSGIGGNIALSFRVTQIQKMHQWAEELGFDPSLLPVETANLNRTKEFVVTLTGHDAQNLMARIAHELGRLK